MPKRAISIPVAAGVAVSAVLHTPASKAVRSGVMIILGHGAGADMHAPLLTQVAEGLSRRGHAVLRFNFPYKELGRKAPDPAGKLEQAYEAAILAAKKTRPDRLILGGKSMGGRIASLLAARGVASDGLCFLGYPLHPAGKPEQLRNQHLAAIQAPMLFLQGTRDPLCDPARLRPVLACLGKRASLHVIEGGDHSLELLKSAGRTSESVLEEILGAIDRWLSKPAPGKIARTSRPPSRGRSTNAMPPPIVVNEHVHVPASALSLSVARASGPGGQNVNKVSSKVDVRVDLSAIVGLTDGARARLAAKQRARIDANGMLQVTSQKTRDQAKNLADAYDKIRAMIEAALVEPKKRRATRPSRGAVESRLRDKRLAAARKQTRGARSEED